MFIVWQHHFTITALLTSIYFKPKRCFRLKMNCKGVIWTLCLFLVQPSSAFWIHRKTDFYILFWMKYNYCNQRKWTLIVLEKSLSVAWKNKITKMFNVYVLYELQTNHATITKSTNKMLCYYLKKSQISVKYNDYICILMKCH